MGYIWLEFDVHWSLGTSKNKYILLNMYTYTMTSKKEEDARRTMRATVKNTKYLINLINNKLHAGQTWLQYIGFVWESDKSCKDCDQGHGK